MLQASLNYLCTSAFTIGWSADRNKDKRGFKETRNSLNSKC